jgi:hypothetical protein
MAVFVFKIRHVDIKDSIQEFQSFERIIPSGVVNKGDGKPFFYGEGEGFQDLRDIMSRSDKIDIVAAQPLKLNHHPAQLFERNLSSFSKMANRKILAKHTFKITVCEKNCSRPVDTHKRIFFPKMWGSGRDFRIEPGPAETCFSFKAVHTAVAGAKSAGFE